MRKVSTRCVAPGTTLAQSVYSQSGSTVLNAGTRMDQATIDKLVSLGIEHVLIDDPRVADVDVPQPVSEETRNLGISVLKDIYANLRAAHSPQDVTLPYDRIEETISAIEYDLKHSAQSSINLIDVRATGDFMLVHPLNVAILAMAHAKRAGFAARAHDAAMGGLLCDVGLMFVPPRVREAVQAGLADVSREDTELYRKHPEFGIRLLRLSNRFSSFVRAVVFQHHERNDGSGFPRGLRGSEIDPLARIVSVADTYAAMVSPGAGMTRLMPHEAQEYLMSTAGFEFDHSTVQSFLHLVIPYPPGTTVRLNTGEKGVVVSVPKGLGTRPTVRVLTAPDGRELGPDQVFELDLTQGCNQTRLITEVCDD